MNVSVNESSKKPAEAALRPDPAPVPDAAAMSAAAAFVAEAGPVLSGEAHRLRRAINTFLAFPFLFDLVIKDQDFSDLMEGRVQRDLPYLLQRLLQKTLWFWPRIIDAKTWVE